MKLLLTGDLQFSEQVNLSRRTEAGTTTRLEDQVTCFNWIVQVGVKHSCEMMLALGDIFDNRTSVPIAVLDRAGRCFARAKEAFRGVLVLVGNHDAALRSSALSSLQPLSGLATVIDRPRVIAEELAFVPWVEDDDAFRAGVGSVAKVKSARFLFAHTLLEGIVPADVGRAVADLRASRWDRVFLGDVHAPIVVNKTVQYVGAPMQHHYGDAGGDRGVWIFDTTSSKLSFVLNETSPRFHLIKVRADLSAVREGDFVRVQVEDATAAHELAALAGKRTRWVENTTATDEAAPVSRLAVTSSDPYRTILKRYVEFREATPVSGLVDVGVEIMQEVT